MNSVPPPLGGPNSLFPGKMAWRWQLSWCNSTTRQSYNHKILMSFFINRHCKLWDWKLLSNLDFFSFHDHPYVFYHVQNMYTTPKLIVFCTFYISNLDFRWQQGQLPSWSSRSPPPELGKCCSQINMMSLPPSWCFPPLLGFYPSNVSCPPTQWRKETLMTITKLLVNIILVDIFVMNIDDLQNT